MLSILDLITTLLGIPSRTLRNFFITFILIQRITSTLLLLTIMLLTNDLVKVYVSLLHTQRNQRRRLNLILSPRGLTISSLSLPLRFTSNQLAQGTFRLRTLPIRRLLTLLLYQRQLAHSLTKLMLTRIRSSLY